MQLNSGDVLSLPSGTPHHAWTASSSGSVHLSLTCLRPSWSTLVRDTVRDILVAEDKEPHFHNDEHAQTRSWMEKLGNSIAHADLDEILEGIETTRRHGRCWTDSSEQMIELLGVAS